jgi:hypothetical protein
VDEPFQFSNLYPFDHPLPSRERGLKLDLALSIVRKSRRFARGSNVHIEFDVRDVLSIVN